MRRVLFAAFGLYLGAAVATRLAEAAGLRRCECSPACWCRSPLLSAFRWVVPFGHRQRTASAPGREFQPRDGQSAPT